MSIAVRSAETAPTTGIVLAILAMLCFASMDAVNKTLIQDFSAVQILWVRFVVFAIFGMAYAAWRGGRAAFVSHRPGLQVARSLVLVVEIGIFIVALGYLPLADAHAVAAVTPLMVTALSVVFLHEKVGVRRWAAIGVGFIGVLIVLRPGLGVFDPWALLILLGAFMFAVYQILTRRAADYDRPETSLMYTGVVGCIALTMIGPFFWEPAGATDWLLFLAGGLLGLTGHSLLITALSITPASVIQPFNYSLLLWATIVGYVIFDHLPDAATVLGALVVVGSGLYTIHRERVRKIR